MAERYFIKFPTITYANSTCKDITRRPKLDSKFTNNPSLFHKYTLKTGARADLIAENYYQDPFYDWLIYLNNNIVDPYYGWYLNDYDFNQYITKKYGSVEQAQKRVIYYQLNWPGDEEEITPSFYNSNLPGQLKQYYTPVFGSGEKILSYKRQQTDYTTNTNKLLNFNVSISSGDGYSVGEIVDIYNPSVSQIVGGAEVMFANSSTIKVKNISGNTSALNVVRGETSNTISSISETTILYENLTDDEAIFWSPVYYYEYEQEKNEKNKNLRLLIDNYALEVAEQLRKIMKQ